MYPASDAHLTFVTCDDSRCLRLQESCLGEEPVTSQLTDGRFTCPLDQKTLENQVSDGPSSLDQLDAWMG